MSASGNPIRLHPENPRWLEWQGKAVVRITSAEHYGAVLNTDFDYRRYLETLQRDGMNYTGIFAGTYVEPAEMPVSHQSWSARSLRTLWPRG